MITYTYTDLNRSMFNIKIIYGCKTLGAHSIKAKKNNFTPKKHIKMKLQFSSPYHSNFEHLKLRTILPLIFLTCDLMAGQHLVHLIIHTKIRNKANLYWSY